MQAILAHLARSGAPAPPGPAPTRGRKQYFVTVRSSTEPYVVY